HGVWDDLWNHSRFLESMFDEHGLGPGVIHYQNSVELLGGGTGIGLDLLHQLARIHTAGEKLLATGTHRLQTGFDVPFVVTDENHRDGGFMVGLDLLDQVDATHFGFTEVHVDDDGLRLVLLGG